MCGNKKPHSHNNVAAAAEVLDKTGKVMSSYGPYIGGRHSGSNAYNNDTNQDNTRWKIKVNSLHQINNCFYCHNLTPYCFLWR